MAHDADPERHRPDRRSRPRLAAAFWPGLTLILPKQADVPDEVTGGLQTVGIRVPAHPMTQAVLRALSTRTRCTSANRFGRVSPTTAQHVVEEFAGAVPVLDGGPCDVGIESTIVDLTQSQAAMLRPGAILPSDIEAIVGPLTTSDTKAPGTLAQHYQPMTSLLLSVDVEADKARPSRPVSGSRYCRPAPQTTTPSGCMPSWRRLDRLGVDVLIAEAAPQSELGAAINDRLRRAATQFSTD